MHPVLKILIGALMVTVGVYSSIQFWSELLTLIKASVGPLLVLIGAFVVWLESDELKMRRERKSSSTSDGMQRQFTEAIDSEENDSDESVQEQIEDAVQEGHACPECGKSFDTERGMHIHQAQKHE